MQEPLLQDPVEVYVSPEQPDEDVDDKCHQQFACFWTPGEIDFSEDRKQWTNGVLNESERHFISVVLAFFATGDGIVMENLATRFMNDVKMTEVKEFYAFQMGMESIHAKTYTLMLTALLNDQERYLARNAIKEMPVITAKAEWAQHWMHSDRPFGERLVAFAIVEGIFFSGSFCAIYWLKKRNLMPGLCFANELISRDEGLHTDFACLLFLKLLVKKPTEATVHEIVRTAVNIEKTFVSEALSVALIGMNAGLMCQYIEYTADHLLSRLGLSKLYGSENPFDWMELISLQNKTNFFEKRVSEYAKAGSRTPFHRSLDNNSDDSSGGENPLTSSRVFRIDEEF